MSDSVVLDVVCLCAEWCGTCRDYKTVMADLAHAWPHHRFRWIDIEDEADHIGDIDVETFPTLMLVHEGQLLFAGPVLPRMADAHRLIEVQTEGVARGGASRPESLGLPADQLLAFQALAKSLRSLT